MTKIQELRNDLATKKEEVRKFLTENKIEDAEKLMEEVRSLEKNINIQEELDKEEERELDTKIKETRKDKKDMENKDKEITYRSAFAKFLKREVLTEEERNLLKQESRSMSEGTKEAGGYIVPTDDSTKIIKLREADDALQNLITVVPVRTNAGKRTIRLRKGGGTNFELVGEGKKINKKDTPQFKALEFNCKKYGAIYDISDEILEDSNQSVMGQMTEWIGNDSRENRNNLIISILNTKKSVEVKNADDIKKILNKDLNVENAKYAKILTNQDGFHFMDTLKDERGNYLLQNNPSDPTKHMFAGKEIIVVDNSILPSSKDKAPIFVGDFKMACVMFDRKKVSVKITTEGSDAFDNDLTLMRAIEREDVQELDKEAYVKAEVSIAAQTL